MQIGLWSSLADPNVAELLAGCGYNWMMLDLERSTASPADLAASFGHPGEPSHPEVTAAILGGMARLREFGGASGILSLDQAVLRAARGFIAVDVDAGLLRHAAIAQREEWR
ncbi:hypothetical protein [Ponticoccus alexandrii]|uniref:hypothetical protein n=1 Tax=Ponticoccus alexandrii TaxID=1943633 RepID=UPI0003D1C28D|nr:hypothetical protein [Ponticoccus alexandrii]ETA51973.1 hypothetical protein P279_11275 [Rhodobacteraceae bacterium PD-2]